MKCLFLVVSLSLLLFSTARAGDGASHDPDICRIATVLKAFDNPNSPAMIRIALGNQAKPLDSRIKAIEKGAAAGVLVEPIAKTSDVGVKVSVNCNKLLYTFYCYNNPGSSYVQCNSGEYAGEEDEK